MTKSTGKGRGKSSTDRDHGATVAGGRRCGLYAPLARADGNVASYHGDSACRGDDMTLDRRALFVLPLALLTAAPGDATPRRHYKTVAGDVSWDGRWVGAWGGSRPTAQIVKGGRLVAYEYNGQIYPVARSHVTPTKIVYGDNVLVTLTRTGANTAHATIETWQGKGTAELTRQ